MSKFHYAAFFLLLLLVKFCGKGSLLIPGLYFGIFFLSSFGMFVFGQIARRNILRDIQKFGAGMIGPLINYCSLVGLDSKIEETLISILSKLKASDIHHLSAEQRAWLNKMLDRNTWGYIHVEQPLMLAILRAYEQVGKSDAIPSVEKLANGEGYAKHDKIVQKAAQDCLPFLYERGKNETHRQTLLRASQPEADAPETLLRPASAAAATEPQQFLRPAASEVESD